MYGLARKKLGLACLRKFNMGLGKVPLGKVGLGKVPLGNIFEELNFAELQAEFPP